MTTTTLSAPFGVDDPVEVPLTNAPLDRVIAQVRVPRTPKLTSEASIDHVRDVIGGEYPILRQEDEMEIVIGPNGAVSSPSQRPLWRMHSKTGEWSLTVAPDFIALDTNNYTTRKEFCARLGRAIAAVAEAASPRVFDRIGLRYINRLSGQLLEDLDRYVRPQFVGLSTLQNTESVSVIHALSDVLFMLPDKHRLRGRWGLLPPNAQLEASVAALPDPSWFLDIDAFVESVDDFTAAAVGGELDRCARHAYQMFRWVVQDDLLEAAGGRP